MKFRLSLVVAALGLIGLSAAQTAAFTRLVKSNGTQETLQTRAARFVPVTGNGPIIWLIGVAHIGQAGYYKDIQKLLDAQSVVLYEGVQRGDAQKAQGDMSSTYKLFSDTLGLTFQLNGINYKRPTFKNSDLSWDEMTALSVKQGGAAGKEDINKIGEMLDANSTQGKAIATFLVGVKQDPGSQEALRLVLAEGLSNPNALAMILNPVQDGVIVQARNDKVFADLGTALKTEPAPRSVAIFYGAAHMPDLQDRLLKTMGYKLSEERWYTGITGDSKKVTGQGEMILTMFRNLKIPPKKANP